MDCFANTTNASIVPNCMRDSSSSSSCFWEEALYDYFYDSSSSRHSNKEDRDYQTATQALPLNCSLLDHHEDEDEQVEQEGYGAHAALHFDEVAEAGPPARPREFPTPLVQEGTRITLRAVDHRTLQVREVKNVLRAIAPDTDRAYLMKKKTSKSTYGNTYLSVVLKRRTNPTCFSDVEWESTEEFLAITVSPWNPTTHQHRRSSSCPDPVRAIAAMQHVGSYHPHVLGCLDVLQDEKYRYTVTKFHGGIDLQTKIVASREQGAYAPNEPEARKIFSQLLEGIFHLQKKGVCHSNMSLENILIDSNNQNLLIVDLGRSMRIPYNDPSNFGCITGETEGTTRRLVQLLSQDFDNYPAESLMFLPPEVVENEDAFDGFAADLWAAGVTLFILLVGMAPFKSAHYWDAAYAQISSGNLEGLLQSLNIRLSEEATSLLQNLFWRDPRDRLTLAQIMNHAWVKGERFHCMSKTFSGGQLSSVETASTTSSFSTDKAKSSSGSKTSVRRTLSDIFSSATSSTASSTRSYSSGSLSKTLSKMLTSKKRSTSIGGLSSAASTATAGSPATPRNRLSDDNNMKFDVKVLHIPQL